RRRQRRGLHRPPRPHQYAPASAGDAQRPRLRGGRRGARPAHPRRGRPGPARARRLRLPPGAGAAAERGRGAAAGRPVGGGAGGLPPGPAGGAGAAGIGQPPGRRGAGPGRAGRLGGRRQRAAEPGRGGDETLAALPRSAANRANVSVPELLQPLGGKRPARGNYFRRRTVTIPRYRTAASCAGPVAVTGSPVPRAAGEPVMATIAVCPYCNQGKVRAPKAAEGLSATCPRCHSSFPIVDSGELTPPPARPTGPFRAPAAPAAAPPAEPTEPAAAPPS